LNSTANLAVTLHTMVLPAIDLIILKLTLMLLQMLNTVMHVSSTDHM